MRNLILSFLSFNGIIAGLYFICSNEPNKHETEVIQHNIAVTKVSTSLPASNIKPVSEAVEMLTQGEWKIQSITSNKPCDTNYDGYFTTDIFSEMPSCALDDIVKFYSDGIVAYHRNERCELTEQDVEKYNWFYTDMDNKINIARGSVEAVMILRSLSAEQLIVEIPMQEGGESHIFTITYHHPAPSYTTVAMR